MHHSTLIHSQLQEVPMTTRLSLFALLSLFVLSSAVAQTEAPTLTTGSRALLFSFGGLANLNANAFDGGVGGKYYISNDWALRGGIQFATANRTIPANPGPGQVGTDGSQSAWRFGISAALEYHLTKNRVSPYVGGGMGFSLTRTESKNTVIGTGAQTTRKNSAGGETIEGATYVAGSAIGVYGLAGVEFFLVNEVSLAAEYRLGLTITSRADEEVTSGNTTVTTKVGGSTIFGVATGGALTLSVYF